MEEDVEEADAEEEKVKEEKGGYEGQEDEAESHMRRMATREPMSMTLPEPSEM